jgi:hypothetical protein
LDEGHQGCSPLHLPKMPPDLFGHAGAEPGIAATVKRDAG